VIDRRSFLLTGLAATTLWPAAGRSALAQPARVQVEGQSFEPSVQLFGHALQLNGTGVRAVAWFKGFAAGLYLGSAARTAAQAVATPGPKRVQLRMLHEVPVAELTRAVRKGVLRNSSAAEQVAMTKRLDQFDAQFAALKSVRVGDVIDLDLEPGQGLHVRINGQSRGAAITGEDFYAAVLRSFVGERPYDDKLKAGLLGKPA
jgi:hypothetical protein